MKKKKVKTTNQKYIKFCLREKCQQTFNLLHTGGAAHGDAKHLERSKQKTIYQSTNKFLGKIAKFKIYTC